MQDAKPAITYSESHPQSKATVSIPIQPDKDGFWEYKIRHNTQ